jgi:hypothetical protein
MLCYEKGNIGLLKQPKANDGDSLETIRNYYNCIPLELGLPGKGVPIAVGLIMVQVLK